MQTDKPLISILMAVYEPRLDWLKEQLDSLDAQTYPNLRLFVCDDCSPTVPLDSIQSCLEACIHSFPFVLTRNKENLGSTKTFERLTQTAAGAYFAYCDQDDIWMPEKLSVLMERFQEPDIQLVCSDVQVIDGSGHKIADSITRLRRRHRFLSGQESVLRSLLTRNFAIGCTMLVRRETALSAIPFLPEMVHDHWLAMVAASQGTVVSLGEPLIQYRIHGGNQTGVLLGISSKHEYINRRIIAFEQRIRQIRGRLPDTEDVERVYQWAKARVDYAVNREPGAGIRLWRLRDENRATTFFDLFALRVPETLFRQALRIARKFG